MANPEESGNEPAREGVAGEATRPSRERVMSDERPNYDQREERIPLKRRPAGPPLDPADETRSRERPAADEEPEKPVDPADPS